jgi:DNA gyrase subunit A
MQKAYIDYSMSVIIGRALPDARDGLKPGNRRILYAMRERGWSTASPSSNAPSVVGEVIGNYHPHGDAAVYDTLVRMAQDFSMRYPLIKGQGNFGSIDGDPPAAYRYTECKLERLAEEMLAGHRKRHRRHAAQLRRVAAGAQGPARPHPQPAGQRQHRHRGGHGHQHPAPQPGRGDRRLRAPDRPAGGHRGPDEFIKGPDFPTGGVIHGKNAIRQMYETGRGHLKVRGRATIEETGGREVHHHHRDPLHGEQGDA